MFKYLSFILKSALIDFQRNKVRTILTSLGILIGVLSVILVIAFGLGLKKSISDQFDSLGTNQLVIFPGAVLSGGRFRGGGSSLGSIRFDERDVTSLQRNSDLKYVVPFTQRTTSFSHKGRSEIGDLVMSSENIFPIRNLTVKYGREFTPEDNSRRAKTIVMGSKIATKLFGDSNLALGEDVKVESQTFKVIGVLQPVGSTGFGGPDFDTYVILPYKTGYIFNTDKKFSTLLLKANAEVSTKDAKESVEKILLRKFKKDDFSIVELTQIQQAITDIFGILNVVLLGIAGISLLVGGIGIMNIMYVTVTERTKEIGVRRALGARTNDILIQFLLESVILSLFGGLLGIVLAIIIVQAIQSIFPAIIDVNSVFIALGVSSAIGVGFGVFPARKASKLSPIEAIRYE